MSISLPLLLAALGAALGCLVTWLAFRTASAVLRSSLSSLHKDLSNARSELSAATQQNAALNKTIAGLEATLTHERKAGEEKLALVDHATEELREAFRALSADALKSNNQAFLELAKTSLERFQTEARGDLELRQQAVATLVSPIEESLKKVDEQIQQIEKARNQAYGDLTAQVRSLITTQEKLQAETGNLVKPLAPLPHTLP